MAIKKKAYFLFENFLSVYESLNEEILPSVQKIKSSRSIDNYRLYKRYGNVSRIPQETVFEEDQIMSQYQDNLATIQFLKDRIEKRIYTESGELGAQHTGTVDASTIASMQNVKEVEGESSDSYSMVRNFLDMGLSAVPDITHYLERPVEISRGTILINQPYYNTFRVWNLLTLEPSVRAKLRNFAYFRATINIKIVVTGTPFHSGRILVSYQPFPLRNAALAQHLSNFLAFGTPYDPLLLNYLSQAKNSSLINVNENKPLELSVPFLHSKPLGRLFNSSTAVLSSATSYDDFANMGTLFLKSLGNISAVSDTAGPVSVQVFAWFTDVSLGAPTGTHIEIVTESGDERRVGPVEAVTSAALKITRVAESIPQISLMAKASTIALSGVNKLAALFGWSYPVVEQRLMTITPCPYSNGVNVIGESTATRIVFDPKQELSVDTSFSGTDTDEMVISAIASRWSYFTSFEWDSASTTADLLFKMSVSPNCYGRYVNYMQPTACAFAVQPFRWWRGKMEYRFEFICSSFHRGKLVIIYEPNTSQNALIDTAFHLNKQYITMIDIQEAQTFSICVEWCRDRAWLFNDYEIGNNLTQANFFLTSPDSFNGYFRILPFTQLTSPDSQPIQVAVFVRAVDLQVQYPKHDNLPATRIYTESGDGSVESTPYSCMIINPSSMNDEWVCQHHFGEQPISFRSLLKRFTTTAVASIPIIPTNNSRVNFTESIFPRPFAVFSGSIGNTRRSIFDYLRYAYLGSRGSIRKRVNLNVNLADPALRSAAYRFDSGAVAVNPTCTLNTVTNIQIDINGESRHKPNLNSGFEVEFPYYSSNLFSFTCATDDVGTQATGETAVTWCRSYTFFCDASVTTETGSIVVDTASGEDFTFIRFLGAPPFSL